MALLIGRQTQNFDPSIVPSTDLIAKCFTEDGLIKLMGQYVNTAIGQLKFELNPKHFYNSSNIDNAEYAYKFKDGWAYPNGTFISQYYFPDMFAELSRMTYPVRGDKVISGNRIVEGSKIINDQLIQLPIVDGYLYGDNQAPSHNSIVHVSPSYSLEQHKHKMSLKGDKTRIHVPNGAWIWSTENPGRGSSVAAETYGGYHIPASASAHSGSGKTDKKRLTWDIPADADGTMTQIIETNSGEVILGSDAIKYTSKTDIHPQTQKLTALIYIGIPQHIL